MDSASSASEAASWAKRLSDCADDNNQVLSYKANSCIGRLPFIMLRNCVYLMSCAVCLCCVRTDDSVLVRYMYLEMNESSSQNSGWAAHRCPQYNIQTSIGHRIIRYLRSWPRRTDLIRILSMVLSGTHKFWSNKSILRSNHADQARQRKSHSPIGT